MNILFVGSSGAARAPLAEAIAQHLDLKNEYQSASVRPSHVRSEVFQVLDELEIAHRGIISRSFFEANTENIELVISLYWGPDDFPGCEKAQVLRWPLPDPTSAPKDERLDAFRATRDELIRRLESWLSNQ